jgi:hypothetical protein
MQNRAPLLADNLHVSGDASQTESVYGRNSHMARVLRLTLVFLSVAGIVFSLCMLANMGCSKPNERLNAPPQGHTDHPNRLQEPFVYMTDNAMLADMSMSSVHFVPHQSELNSLGERRLKRLVQILKIYGGMLRYDGVTDDVKLANGRVAQLKDFILAAGLEADRVEVKRTLAGGEGMNAAEAILVRQASTFQPEQQQQGGSAGGYGQPGGSTASGSQSKAPAGNP